MMRLLSLVLLVASACGGSSPRPLRWQGDRAFDGDGRLVRMTRDTPGGAQEEALDYDGSGRVKQRIVRYTVSYHELGCIEASPVITEQGPSCLQVGELPRPAQRFEAVQHYRYDAERRPIGRTGEVFLLEGNQDGRAMPEATTARQKQHDDIVVWTWRGSEPIAASSTYWLSQAPSPSSGVYLAQLLDEARHIRDLGHQ